MNCIYTHLFAIETAVFGMEGSEREGGGGCSMFKALFLSFVVEWWLQQRAGERRVNG